jgi:hypothetical protein
MRSTDSAGRSTDSSRPSGPDHHLAVVCDPGEARLVSSARHLTTSADRPTRSSSGPEAAYGAVGARLSAAFLTNSVGAPISQ